MGVYTIVITVLCCVFFTIKLSINIIIITVFKYLNIYLYSCTFFLFLGPVMLDEFVDWLKNSNS